MDSRQRLRYRWQSFSRAETGFVKTCGQRLPSMDSSRFAKQPRTRAPGELQEVISPLLRLISQLNIEIRGYDRLIAKKVKDR
jgi:hypothetical protein